MKISRILPDQIEKKNINTHLRSCLCSSPINDLATFHICLGTTWGVSTTRLSNTFLGEYWHHHCLVTMSYVKTGLLSIHILFIQIKKEARKMIVLFVFSPAVTHWHALFCQQLNWIFTDGLLALPLSVHDNTSADWYETICQNQSRYVKLSWLPVGKQEHFIETVRDQIQGGVWCYALWKSIWLRSQHNTGTPLPISPSARLPTSWRNCCFYRLLPCHSLSEFTRWEP